MLLKNLPCPLFDVRKIKIYWIINGPPRSCDLTPLDYFIKSYMKSEVQKNNPLSISQTHYKIICVIGEVEQKLWLVIIRNLTKEW